MITLGRNCVENMARCISVIGIALIGEEWGSFLEDVLVFMSKGLFQVKGGLQILRSFGENMLEVQVEEIRKARVRKQF